MSQPTPKQPESLADVLTDIAITGLLTETQLARFQLDVTSEKYTEGRIHQATEKRISSNPHD